MKQISMQINVDQNDDPNTISLDVVTLGANAYVLVEYKVDAEGNLVLDTRIGGEAVSVSQMGEMLTLVGNALTQQGDTLIEQALDSADGEACLHTTKGAVLHG